MGASAIAIFLLATVCAQGWVLQLVKAPMDADFVSFSKSAYLIHQKHPIATAVILTKQLAIPQQDVHYVIHQMIADLKVFSFNLYSIFFIFFFFNIIQKSTIFLKILLGLSVNLVKISHSPTVRHFLAAKYAILSVWTPLQRVFLAI